MMRIYSKFAVLLVLVLLLVSGFSVLQAQDTTISCDSDLLVNLSIAERFFGFDTLQNQMMTTNADNSTVLALNTYDRGQYESLYTTQQSVMDPSIPNYGILTEEQFNNVIRSLSQDDATFDTQFNTTTGFDAAAGTMLNSGIVADEAAECTALRTQLNRFFRAVLSEDVTSGIMIGHSADGMSNTANMESTAKATPESMSEATPEATPSS